MKVTAFLLAAALLAACTSFSSVSQTSEAWVERKYGFYPFYESTLLYCKDTSKDPSAPKPVCVETDWVVSR